MRSECRILIARPEGRGTFGRPRHRWERNKIDVKETEFGGASEVRVKRE
jgi:hypothetical protein